MSEIGKLLVFFGIILLLLGGLFLVLGRTSLPLGRLPGDFRFRFAGREWFVPLASSVVMSLIALGVSKLL